MPEIIPFPRNRLTVEVGPELPSMTLFIEAITDQELSLVVDFPEFGVVHRFEGTTLTLDICAKLDIPKQAAAESRTQLSIKGHGSHGSGK